jgi:F5/8 type C domain
MNSKDIQFTETVNINAILDGGLADADVTYEVPHLYASYISVDAAGVVTPLSCPDGSAGAIVLIKDAVTGEEIGKVVIAVKDHNDTLVVGIEPVAPAANMVPLMTSNTTPSGVVTCSSEATAIPGFEGNYAARFVFDQNDQTFVNYGINDDAWYTWSAVVGAAFPQWVAYEFDAAKTATKYAIWARAHVSYSDTAPKDWTFQGSNDGANWTTLDTRTNEAAWAPSERREYTIATPASYLHYRLHITAHNGTIYAVCVGELEIIGQD